MTDEMPFVLAFSAIILMWRDIALMWLKQEAESDDTNDA